MLTDTIDDCFVAEYILLVILFRPLFRRVIRFFRPGSGAGYDAQYDKDPDSVG